MRPPAANTAFFDLDFTRSPAGGEDFFEVVAVCERNAGHGRRVALIVDGDADAGERTAQLLRAEGWHAAVESTPREAARHMSRLGTPDLLLLEADLPQMSGFEFLERLRANQRVKDTPVVMLARRATRADLVRAFECGADGYITKGVGGERILGSLRRLFGEPAAQG